MSLSEPFQKPTTMLYRNLLAMETEELLRSLSGRRRGADGRLRQDHAGADHGRAVDEPAGDLHAGRADAARQLAAAGRSAAAATPGSTGPSCAPATSPRTTGAEIEDGIARSPGHCMTMGTASTMTSAAEALGLTLPGAASIPAADSRHARMADAHRPAHRRDGVGGPASRRDILDATRVRQRDHDGAGAGRLDQRDRAPDRDGAPRRRRARPRPLRRARAPHAGARQHPARRAST